MEKNLELYEKIQDLVKKDARDEAERVYDEKGSQYDVNQTPIHLHNGIDSPRIPPASLEIIEFLPANNGGVVSPGILGDQVVDNPAEAGFGNPATVPIFAAPVIYGFGTTSSITFTGTPSLGASSATLTAPWGGSSPQAVQFASGEVRNVAFSGTSATWAPPLNIGAVSATATVVANARFKGGEAPYGTVVFFRNDDDGLRQLWFRSLNGSDIGTWWGIDAGTNFVY